jgi:endonuclease/exonuclease/phosphatase family metal-dependent hydrolase
MTTSDRKRDSRRLRNLVAWLAWAYPVSLVLTIAAMRLASPHVWQAELALYLPRIVFAIPLPILATLLLVLRLRRALLSQVVAAGLVLFPLMGLEVPSLPPAPKPESAAFRLLSYNPNFASTGQDALIREIAGIDPDIALFQQLYFTDQLTAALRSRYTEVRTDGEFYIASRFPIRSTEIPPPLSYQRRNRSARFIRYQVDASFGPLVIYSVHPASPRGQFAAARSGGLRQAIRSGALFSLAARPDIESDSGLRALQVLTMTRMADRETLPVIIAGDTNLPTLSPSLARFAKYQDGFEAAGSGFGYTFPSDRPWMRIDRIFASGHLEFRSFRLGCGMVSDHLCVYADVQARAGWR